MIKRFSKNKKSENKLSKFAETQIRLYKSCFQETEQGFVQIMELPPIDDIFREMRLATKKPITSSVDSGRKNNSDMDNNSVMVRTESSKDYSEFIVAQETGSTVQKYDRSNKTTVFDFPKAEGVVHFSSDYCIIKRQVLAEGSLSTEHNNGGKKGTLACQHKVVSSSISFGSTDLTGSTNWLDRYMKDVTMGCHQEEKQDIIQIKVPRLQCI